MSTIETLAHVIAGLYDQLASAQAEIADLRRQLAEAQEPDDEGK